jgi:hypothetical protein
MVALGCFTLGEGAPSILSTRGLVGPRADLDAVQKRKIFLLPGTFTLERTVRSPATIPTEPSVLPHILRVSLLRITTKPYVVFHFCYIMHVITIIIWSNKNIHKGFLIWYCDGTWSIARRRVDKHILAATNTQAKIEELPFLFNGR